MAKRTACRSWQTPHSPAARLLFVDGMEWIHAYTRGQSIHHQHPSQRR